MLVNSLCNNVFSLFMELSLQVTLPVPPNPVKARKAAAARAAKEAKMKNTKSLAQLQVSLVC